MRADGKMQSGISLLLLLLLGTVSANSHAGEAWQGIQTFRDPSGALTLKAPCSRIFQITRALAAWKTRLGETPGEAPILSDASGCSAKIDAVAPSAVDALTDTFSRHDGPNCWNTTLYSTQVVLTRRAVSSDEMTFWTNSPLCRPLSDDEPAIPGDVIAARYAYQGEMNEMHGFVYVSDDLSFSKSGFDSQFPYDLAALDYEFTLTALGKDVAKPRCRRVVGTPSDCPVFANYYRCQGYRAFVDASSFQGKSEFLAFDRKLTAFERDLSAVVTGGAATPEVVADFTDRLAELKREGGNDLVNPGNFFWKSALMRIGSFETQIEILRSGD